MKGLLVASLGLAVAGCGAGDDVAAGAQGPCARGGELTACPDAERTPEAACWRLVDCGAIPIDHPDDFRIDWGSCVDGIASLTEERQRLVISCIATSTCSQLQSDSSTEPDTDDIYCLSFGGN
jgi:hypothetical protein